MEKRFWVYILASKQNGTLYVGVTSDLVKRVYEHKSSVVDGFTKRYGIHRLVCFEEHGSAEAAIKREKRFKKYKRDWKINLIEQSNPDWNDLYEAICG